MKLRRKRYGDEGRKGKGKGEKREGVTDNYLCTEEGERSVL